MSVDLAERTVAELLERERALQAERDRHAALQSEVDRLRGKLQALGADEALHLGELRRTSPVSDRWGTERGMPVDRHYIASFLGRHRNDIRGRVLEVKDPGYSHLFGNGRVTAVDVLDVDAVNPRATVIADLARADQIQSETYDCVVLTQVLGLVPDVAAAIGHVFRILKPGGVLLCTVPASGRLSYEPPGPSADYWRFTEASVTMLFERSFPRACFSVQSFGNVLAASAFLYGMAHHELTAGEIDAADPFFPIVYAIRARKPERPAAGVLMYHRIADAVVDPRHLCVSPANFRSQLAMLQRHGIRVVPLPELAARAASGELAHGSVALTFDDGYRDGVTVAAPILREFGFPATFFVIANALRGEPFPWDPTAEPMSADDVRRLAALPGMEVGSHSESHPKLPELSSTERARELACSKSHIEAITGKAVTSLAYPYGLVDDATEAAAAAAGYRYALTTETASLTRSSAPLRLPRFEVPDCNGDGLLAMLRHHGLVKSER